MFLAERQFLFWKRYVLWYLKIWSCCCIHTCTCVAFSLMNMTSQHKGVFLSKRLVAEWMCCGVLARFLGSCCAWNVSESAVYGTIDHHRSPLIQCSHVSYCTSHIRQKIIKRYVKKLNYQWNWVLKSLHLVITLSHFHPLIIIIMLIYFPRRVKHNVHISVCSKTTEMLKNSKRQHLVSLFLSKVRMWKQKVLP